MQKHLCSILFFLLVFSSGTYAQGIGINNSGNNPDASAGLDVNFTDKGFLAH